MCASQLEMRIKCMQLNIRNKSHDAVTSRCSVQCSIIIKYQHAINFIFGFKYLARR